MPDDPAYLTLLNHPATPAPMVRTLEAQAALLPDGGIIFRYRLWGDMARLLVPEPQAPARTDLLWEHTCFEAFVGVRGSAAYREFNFSPSGQWAAYAFCDYRKRSEDLPKIAPPRISTRLFAGHLELEATVAAEALPPKPGDAPWQIGLAAVVEAADTVDGKHSYWALRHPSPRPDFHDRGGFALELACHPR